MYEYVDKWGTIILVNGRYGVLQFNIDYVLVLGTNYEYLFYLFDVKHS